MQKKKLYMNSLQGRRAFGEAVNSQIKELDQPLTSTLLTQLTYAGFKAALNTIYMFRATIIFQSNNPANGLRLSATCAGASPASLHGMASIPESPTSIVHGAFRASGGVVESTSIDLTATDTVAMIWGKLVTTTTQPKFNISAARSGGVGTTTVMAGSVFEYWIL